MSRCRSWWSNGIEVWGEFGGAGGRWQQGSWEVNDRKTFFLGGFLGCGKAQDWRSSPGSAEYAQCRPHDWGQFEDGEGNHPDIAKPFETLQQLRSKSDKVKLKHCLKLKPFPPYTRVMENKPFEVMLVFHRKYPWFGSFYCNFLTSNFFPTKKARRCGQGDLQTRLCQDFPRFLPWWWKGWWRVDGGLMGRNPAPVEGWGWQFIPVITWFYTHIPGGDRRISEPSTHKGVMNWPWGFWSVNTEPDRFFSTWLRVQSTPKHRVNSNFWTERKVIDDDT